MNDNQVKWVLRADAIFNMFAGIALQFYIRALLDLIGWPDTDARVYAIVLGSALIGLSLIVWLASYRPRERQDVILVSAITKTLAGVSILHQIYIAGIELPSPILLPAAVGVQVLFVLGELLYLVRMQREKRSTGKVRRAH
jgi:hypothetical protein